MLYSSPLDDPSNSTTIKSSPGLNMEHGFLRHIEHNQMLREKQSREDQYKSKDSAKLARRVGFQLKNSKPSMEIYRPPKQERLETTYLEGRVPLMNSAVNAKQSSDRCLRSDRSPADYSFPPPPTTSGRVGQQVNPGADPPPQWFQQMPLSAAPLVMSSAGGHPHLVGLAKSRSTTTAHRVHFQLQPSPLAFAQAAPTASTTLTSAYNGSHMASTAGDGNVTSDGQHRFAGGGGATASRRVDPPVGSNFGLKRSKSLGSTGDMKMFTCISQDLDISSFGAEVQSAIKRALEDPNKVPARQLMEIVRHLFSKVLDSVRYAEPTAKLCIAIIEKERNETFLESLLNSCREWYNERDRLFNTGTGSGQQQQQLQQPPMKPSRWVAYVTFLYELYTRLKSKKSIMNNSNMPPSALILTLLSECCLLFLKPASLMGLCEIECLFIVVTSIGRDLQKEFPQRLQALMSAVREAFLIPAVPQKARMTLLQLIELHASDWHLMAPAVTYYYPASLRD